VNAAFEKNTEINVLMNSIDSAKAKTKETRSAYFPQVSGKFQVLRSLTPLSSNFGSGFGNIPGFDLNPEITNYTAGFSLTQNIWDFGRTANLDKSASKAEERAVLKYEKKKQEIRLNIRKSYYDFLKAKAFVKTARDNIREIESLKAAVIEKEKNGLATGIDVMNVEAEYLRYISDLNKAAHSAEITGDSLMMMIGISLEKDFDISEAKFKEPEEFPLGLKSYEEGVKKALVLNPEIKEAELSLMSAKTGIDFASSDWFPYISGSASYDWQDNVFPPKQNSWAVGLNITVPIFSGFAKEARSEQADAELKSAARIKKQTEETTVLDVKINYFRSIEGREYISYVVKKTAFLTKNLEAINAKYKEGLDSVNELI
jgi:outer membrane protein TolC